MTKYSLEDVTSITDQLYHDLVARSQWINGVSGPSFGFTALTMVPSHGKKNSRKISRMLSALSASRKDTTQTSVPMSSRKPLTNLFWKTLCPLKTKPPRRNHGESVLLQPALPPRSLEREASSIGASTVAAGIGPTRVRNTEIPARRPLMDQRHQSHRLPPQAHPMLSLFASDLATSPLIQPLNDGDAS